MHDDELQERSSAVSFALPQEDMDGFEEEDDDTSSGASTLDSQGKMRRNSTLARATSFVQMERARGRVPSVREEAPECSPAPEVDLPTEATPSESDVAQPDSPATSFLAGVAITEAQMRLMGVSSRAELRAQFNEVLASRERGGRPAAGERPGPAVGRATLEAIVDAALEKKHRRDVIALRRVDELADRPSTRKPRLMTPDDERNCTFAPRTKSRKSLEIMKQCGYDFARTADRAPDPDAFVERLSRSEKQRRRKLEHARGQAEYTLRLNKKKCPRCGATQTYDEVVEKRRKCQECGVAYRVPRPKGGFDDFLEAQADRERRRRQNRADAQAAQLECRTCRPEGPDLSYKRALRAKVDAEAGKFLERVARDLNKRRQLMRDCERRKDEQPPLPPPPQYTRRANKPHVATFPPGPRVAPVISKWEDDLEEYIRRASTKRQHEADRKRELVASAARRRAEKLTSHATKVQSRKAATTGYLASPNTSVDLDKFDELLDLG